MKTLVYTAIFGDKDEAPVLLKKEGVNLSNYRFLCVTDNPKLKSEDYEVVLVNSEFSDVTKNARKVKVNGYGNMGEYDVAIWHDSSVRLHADQINGLIEMGMSKRISVFHHIRYCAYLEAIACIDQRKDAPLRIALQMMRYFIDGFPANNKLYETTIMVLNREGYFGSELQRLWWDELKNGSRRDQLSLAYASWKTKTEINLIADWTRSGSDNDFSTWIGHQHAKYLHKSLALGIDSKLIRGVCKKLIYTLRRSR